MRNEFSVHLPVSHPSVHWLASSVSPFLAYDIGKIVKDSTDIYERGTLSGISAGLRFNGAHVSGDVTISTPLSAPGFIEKDKYNIYWSLSTKF